ncbi:unnamed protein product [Parnassius apollo]|uniref:(apollo) hypothetical protein n=1 Tax=Parnassius apollo TaxID=110799 RepID=A0A8S3XVG3_PARAO|nr:unnamed protein product [Parnassius apollo]
MAPSKAVPRALPALAAGIENLDTYMTVVQKLTGCIITAINVDKSVTVTNKKLINLAAEEIQMATDALTLFMLMGTTDTCKSNSELKNFILASMKEEIADIKKLIATNKPTYAETAAVARGTSAPTGLTASQSSPTASKPAMIVSPMVEVKFRQEAVKLFKKNINHRTSKYALARIQPVSNHKYRVEFDSKTQ